MIFDTIENLEKYSIIHPYIKEVAAFLKKNIAENLQNGKHNLVGDNLFVSVNEYVTKEQRDVKWEKHNVYADIQLVTKGAEQIGYANAKNLEITEPYNTQKDIAFYKGNGDYLTLTPGTFILLFAGEAHRPGVIAGKICEVKKLVFKIKI